MWEQTVPRIVWYISVFRYELVQKGELKEEDVGIVPDIYVRNQQLDQELKYIRSEMDKYKEAAL